MSRTSFVTTGVLAILLGIQMNFVDSFVLTPRATKFWQSRFRSNAVFQTQPLNGIAGAPAINGSNTSGYVPNARPAANLPYAQNPAYAGQQQRGQLYQQYSRSYARNNYPFNSPNYAGSTAGLPSFNRPGLNNNNTTSALPVGYASANQPNQFAGPGLFGPQKTITPPKWISWASIFLGAVLFIFGAARGRG